MTWFRQMLMEDGMKQGMERGEFKTLQELVVDGVLTVAEAATRKEMTETEFSENEVKIIGHQ